MCPIVAEASRFWAGCDTTRFDSSAVACGSLPSAWFQLCRMRSLRVNTKLRRLPSSSSTTRPRRRVDAVTLFACTCSSVELRRFDIASSTTAKAIATSTARTPIAPSTRVAIGAERMPSAPRLYARSRPPVRYCGKRAMSAIVGQEGGDHRRELVRVERLRDETGRSGSPSLLLIGLRGKGGDDEATRVLQMPDDVETRAPGHHHVDKGDVRPELVSDLQRLGHALGLGEPVVADERHAHQLPQCRLVV